MRDREDVSLKARRIISVTLISVIAALPQFPALIFATSTNGRNSDSVSGSISYGEVPDLTGLFDEPGA
ncbi:MAG: hypothetical protein FWH55_10455, partial [Oscillospiraceae bacterium]|nr:hypothetical protein [Oscillospiraceae bacterium]